MTDAKLPPAIVLDGGITALGVIRSLGRLGAPTYVSAHPPGVAGSSRWYRSADEVGTGPRRSGGLAEWLTGVRLPSAVLVPCSDETLVEVASLTGDLAERFPASVPPISTVEQVVDKRRFAGLLEGLGLPHPRTLELLGPGDLDGIDDDLLAHCIVKPAHSQEFFRAYRRKAFRPDSRSDARRLVARILAEGHPVVLQEMIEGPAERQLCVDGFVDRHGRVRARFARRWLRKYPHDFGESCLAVSVSLTEVRDAVASADAILGSLDYRGVFSVEFKARGDRYHVLEMNARPWWYIGFTGAAGVPVCAMTYHDAIGYPVESVDTYRTGLHVAHPELHWAANRSLPRSARDSVPRLLTTWATSVQPVFSPSDPGPTLSALTRRLRRRLGRSPKAVTAPDPQPAPQPSTE